MSRLFLDILNLSIAASWLIAAVLIIRAVIMRKTPKWVSCLLWAVVGLRLLIPFSFESPISLVPSVQTFNTDAVYAEVSGSEKTPEQDTVSNVITDENVQIGDVSANETPMPDTSVPETQKPETSYGDIQTDNVGSVKPITPKPQTQKPAPEYIHSGINAIDDKVNTAINENIAESSGKTENTNPIRAFADIASVVWVIGIALMIIYAVANYILLRRRVTPFVPCEDGVRRSESVGSPFILGFIRPRIYLPFGLSDETENHIIAHERAHLKRRDHWIKPIGYAILAVYWFNPLVWVAYVLLCRDIEYACDEKVVQSMDANARKAYASALLECGVKRRFIAACPVAFGEIGVKERVKNALSYKKPMLWIIVAAIIITSVVAVLFLTSPQNGDDASSQKTDESSDTVSEEISDTSSESSDETSNDANGDASSDTPSDTPEDSIDSDDVYITYINKFGYLPIKHKGFFEGLLSSDGWIDEIAECEPDFTIRIGETKYEYSSDCGIINGNGRSKSLTESEQDELNDILAEVFPAYKELLSEPEYDPYIGDIRNCDMRLYALNMNVPNCQSYLIHNYSDLYAFLGDANMNVAEHDSFYRFVTEDVLPQAGFEKESYFADKSWIIVYHKVAEKYIKDIAVEIYGEDDGIHVTTNITLSKDTNDGTVNHIIIIEADKKYLGGADAVHSRLIIDGKEIDDPDEPEKPSDATIADTLSEFLDNSGFDENLWQGKLMDLMRLYSYNGESIETQLPGTFYDGYNGGGYDARGKLFGYWNDYNVSEDNRATAKNMFYTKVQLEGLFTMPCGITFDDTFSSALQKLGIEIDPKTEFPVHKDTVKKLYYSDDRVITITGFASSSTKQYAYEILYTENHQVEASDGTVIDVLRSIELSFTDDNKLGYFEMAVIEEYDRS